MLAITTTNIILHQLMTEQLSKQQQDDDVILHIIVILIILTTLFFQFLSLLWPFNRFNMTSPQSLVTHPLPTMKDKNLPTLPSASTSLKTEEDGRTSTGKVTGTRSPRSRNAKNGFSTQSASRQKKTKSNPTTPTVGFQSLD